MFPQEEGADFLATPMVFTSRFRVLDLRGCDLKS